jgi:excinuclease ABC subunit B
MDKFKIISDFKPAGDQPKAIDKLFEGLKKGFSKQTLLGVTGSGKTYTIANVISKYQKPTLVLAHNKTLAFQLYQELKELFPKNKVEFFISYYDYYQPESYIPSTDTYIEKDAQINPKIELMRLSATQSLITHNDTIVVASVSAIYGLGKPENYKNLSFELTIDEKINRKELMLRLLEMLYERNDTELLSGRFRVRGNIIDLVPAYQENIIRIQLVGGKIAKISELDKNTLDLVNEFNSIYVFPARHFISKKEDFEKITKEIEEELNDYLPEIRKENELFAYRLEQKINYDIEMLKEMGYCKGVENYSRYFDRRKPHEKPYCLLDYFPDDFLMIIDESHQSLPQVRAMYKGDRSRKETLIKFGFRLPSALDNRPLKFNEFEKYMNNTIFVSATPSDYEKEHSSQIVEQIIRPTGLLDPVVEIKKSDKQVKDMIEECKKTIEKGFRVLVTTLTKRLAEELTDFLAGNDIKVRYLHSEIDSLQRTELIRELRLGKFDVLVGINLLREGLDIPEVGLVTILDADKEGFLRDERSLIQTIGRAARNSESKVILYANNITKSIEKAVSETNRRRQIQIDFNEKHNISPKTIVKKISGQVIALKTDKAYSKKDIPKLLIELDSEMKQAAKELDFEKAIKIRDKLKEIKNKYGF